jgi:integrase
MIEPRFQEAPTTHEITLFLEWFALSRIGLLDEYITDTTVLNRFNSLKRAIKLHTQYQYTAAQNQEIAKFVTKGLVSKKLISTSARPKPLAPMPVARDLIKFLFTCDEYKDLHPRIRIQLVFSIQLMLLIGVRPGEIVESDAWYRSNEGLLYKDVDVIHLQSHTYTGWLLHVRLRNRKGHREYKKHAYVL